MPNKDLHRAISRETVKGEALYQLGLSVAGTYETAALYLPANVADRETITMSRVTPYGDTWSDAFQIVQINTDTTSNSTVLDSTSTANVTETITAHGWTKAGEILRCENEFLQVVSIVDANTVVLKRGYAGSTVASHTDGADIFKRGATALTAGKIYVPVGGTLTPAAAGPQLAAGMTALGTFGYTFTFGTAMLVGFREADGLHETLAETLAGSGNVWAASTSWGGVQTWGGKRGIAIRVPTASEVSFNGNAGQLVVKFPFTPAFVKVFVNVTSSNAAKAWDGAVTISGGLVTLDNSGTTDWATTDTILVQAYAL